MKGREEQSQKILKYAARLSLAAVTLVGAYSAMIMGNTSVDATGPWAMAAADWWLGRGLLGASVLLWVVGIFYLAYAHTLRRDQSFPQWLRPLPGRIIDAIVSWLASLIIVERDA